MESTITAPTKLIHREKPPDLLEGTTDFRT